MPHSKKNPDSLPTPDDAGPRRAHPRVVVNHEFASLDEFITEYVKDLSAGGVFVRAHDPLPVGTRVDLCFTVIADELETVEGAGRVVRVVPAGRGVTPGMGVMFEFLTPQSQQVVERLAGSTPVLAGATGLSAGGGKAKKER